MLKSLIAPIVALLIAPFGIFHHGLATAPGQYTATYTLATSPDADTGETASAGEMMARPLSVSPSIGPAPLTVRIQFSVPPTMSQNQEYILYTGDIAQYPFMYQYTCSKLSGCSASNATTLAYTYRSKGKYTIEIIGPLPSGTFSDCIESAQKCHLSETLQLLSEPYIEKTTLTVSAAQSASSSIIGTWDSNGNFFTFRADGTYASGIGTRIDNYTVKCAQDTGECSKPAYPSSATSRGLWNVVADPSKVMVSNEFDFIPYNTTEPLLALFSAPPAQGSIILHLDDGDADEYEYLEVSFVKAYQTASFSYPIIPQSIGEYTKTSN